MRIFLLLLYSALFSSCFHYHFEFDEVEHYSGSASSDTIQLKMLPAQFQRIRNFIESNDLPPLAEPGLSDGLKIIYSNRAVVDKGHHAELYDIFSDGIYLNISRSRCAPVYRDVLVFKKDGKVTGISKICFDCSMHYTVDVAGYKKELNESAFAQLKRILYLRKKE